MTGRFSMFCYIKRFYFSLLTPEERTVYRGISYEEKIRQLEEQDSLQAAEFYEMFKSTIDALRIDLINVDTSTFEENVCSRISRDHPDIFNRCKKCSALLRTPSAKQCFNCGHRSNIRGT